MYLFGVKYCYNLVRLQIACCHLVFGKKLPSFQNVDIFPELDRCTPCVFIGTVARFSRNKSLLISFGAPVVIVKNLGWTTLLLKIQVFSWNNRYSS